MEVASAARVEAEVKRKGTFEDPTVGRHFDESAEEELEGNALPQAGEAEPGVGRLGLQPVVESLAKRCRGCISH
jgi:hypothetical protein